MNELFNTVRINNQGKIFTRQEIAKLLHGIPYHSYPTFVSVLVKHKAIIKLKPTEYTFTSSPVYHGVLEAVKQELYEQQKMYTKKCSDKNIITEESAIKFLLETGKYEIYQVKQIKEKLSL